MSSFWLAAGIGVAMMIALYFVIRAIVSKIDIPEPGAD